MNLWVLLGFLLLLSWGFAAATTRVAGKELSFWQALGILFTAKLITRAADWYMPNFEFTPRIAVTISIYLVVLTGGLILSARVRPLVALGLATAFTALLFAGIAVFIVVGALAPTGPAR
jgi:hypothetical protein